VWINIKISEFVLYNQIIEGNNLHWYLLCFVFYRRFLKSKSKFLNWAKQIVLSQKPTQHANVRISQRLTIPATVGKPYFLVTIDLSTTVKWSNIFSRCLSHYIVVKEYFEPKMKPYQEVKLVKAGDDLGTGTF